MIDQYELIDKMIANVDALADAKGAHKCALIIEVIQQLSALRKGLKDEEEARKREAEGRTVIVTDEPFPMNGEAMEV